MGKAMRSIVVLMVIMMFTGCAKWDAIYRDHDFTKKSALIGIKQRAILAKDGPKPYDLMICAEPSPDALSAYTAELTAKADLPETVALELAGAFQESSAYVGMRTASIQLLRDRSYRLCEARMNGFINNAQFALQMRREQRNTIALLAIEQLTGALKVPPVAINTKGTAEIAGNVDKLVAQKEEKDKAIEEKTKEVEAINESDEGAQAKIDTLDKEIAELKKSRDALADGIKNGRTMVATGSASAVVQATGMPTQRSDAHILAIAEYVDKIVKRTQTDDFGQMCLICLDKETKVGMKNDLKDICTKYLNDIGQQNAAFISVINAFSDRIQQVDVTTAEDIKTLAEALKLLSEIEPGAGLMGITQAAVKSGNSTSNTDQ